MPKHNKRKRGAGPGAKFTQITRGFTEGYAWRELSMTARILYIDLRLRYNTHNNGDIGLSVREAAQCLKSSPGAIQRAFRDLQEKGFIKNRERGYLGPDGRGIAAKWELTEFSYKGQIPTSDFKCYRAPKKQKPVPRADTDCAHNGHAFSATVADIDTGVSKTGTHLQQNRASTVPDIGTFNNIPCTPCLKRPSNQA